MMLKPLTPVIWSAPETRPLYCPDTSVLLDALRRCWADDDRFDKVFVLTDTHTRLHCLPILKEGSALPEDAVILEMQPGEEFKDVYTCIGLWRSLGAEGASRHSLLINLGGGVVTDLGGFLASVFKRGIRFVNIPTSLLAMLDAAVGGKTGIDLEGIKNEIGTFTLPAATFLYPGFLQTLPARHLWAGFAEALKHGLIADAAYWKDLSGHYRLLEASGNEGDEFRKRLILRSVEIKWDIVSDDPHEQGRRKILNAGHTIGHALESWSLQDDRAMLHGEAIALGLLAETYISTRLHSFPQEVLQQMLMLVKDIYRPRPLPADAIPQWLTWMGHDKKNRGGGVRFSLLKQVGQATTDDNVADDTIVEALTWLVEVCSSPTGSIRS